ncbi:hypothetical protein FQZ97_1233280 [compost metagenome]
MAALSAAVKALTSRPDWSPMMPAVLPRAPCALRISDWYCRYRATAWAFADFSSTPALINFSLMVPTDSPKAGAGTSRSVMVLLTSALRLAMRSM